MSDLATVAVFVDPHTAHLARGRLEVEGIPAFVVHEHHVRLHWVLSNALGGVKLEVPRVHLETAKSLLAADYSEELEATPEARLPLSESERCPACGSAAIAALGLERRTKALSLLLSVPFAYRRGWWRCSDCEHRWRIRNPDRTPLAVLASLLALLVSIAAALLGGMRRMVLWALPFLFAPREFACWRCGAAYGADARACPGCGIALPPLEASQELVTPGKAYDGACESCHTPYSRRDYLDSAERWLCSCCQRPLPKLTS